MAYFSNFFLRHKSITIWNGLEETLFEAIIFPYELLLFFCEEVPSLWIAKASLNCYSCHLWLVWPHYACIQHGFFSEKNKILWVFPAWVSYDKFRIGWLRSVTTVKLTSKYSRKWNANNLKGIGFLATF